MNHDWDDKTGICVLCGITADEYLNVADWNSMFCPGDGQLSLPVQKNNDCCNFPATVYLGGKWFCESCGSPDKDMNTDKTGNYTITKCTCGALKVHGENTPGHYNDCDLKKRR